MAKRASGKRAGKKIETKEKDKLLPKLTTLFFDRPRMTAVIWVALALFGVVSYTTLLKREGFPSVNIPIAIVSGVYAPNDAATVDAKVAKPIADIAIKQDNVSTVQSQSNDNFSTTTVQFKEGTDSSEAVKQLEESVKKSGNIPSTAVVKYNVPHFGATGPEIQQIDIGVSFFATEGDKSAKDLQSKANEAAKYLNDQHIAGVKNVFVKSLYETNIDPATGKEVTVQRTFDRYGEKKGDNATFHNSIIIGVEAEDNTDILKLNDHVQDALNEMLDQPEFKDYSAEISASFAPSIEENISELQRVLLEGLLAILIIGSIVIAIRASIITVISMITVLVASIALLYVIGYTLNVITLFALILSLALIVDDTIIMVEAIDSARKREKTARQSVKVATRKVSRAMVAATLTACLSFAPLLFVGGILGSFIRAIPVTIIASLLISLVVALVFIPFFARFILLGKKQMGKMAEHDEFAAGFEAKLAAFIARPMIWARHSRKKLFSVGIIAIVIGLGFVMAAGFLASKVEFNIFPSSKDTNGVVVMMYFPPETNIDDAQKTAAQAEDMAKQVIGENFEQATYYGSATSQNATLNIEIKSYSKRDIMSPELVKQLEEKFKDFKPAKVVVAQVDLGPPLASFGVQVQADNRAAAQKAANDISAFMSSTTLKRTDGSTAKMTNVQVSNSSEYLRADGKPVIKVASGFDGQDTTTLVTLAQDAINKEFTDAKMKTYGLSSDDLSYDLGQEQENQDSFKTLLLAFPVLLVAMFILLAIQFQSLLQPLLIFLAIPFSLFGVMLGLYITDNAISFFTMLGFFALIGLSIKNTILLTDYANQARKVGASAVDAAHGAVEERFRPLFATSATAVVSLIPLALASPFWEGLAVVLIFGLISNTILVLTVFPYYYLGAEFLRLTFSRTSVMLWLAVVVAGCVLLDLVDKTSSIGFWLVVSIVWPFVYMITKHFMHRRSA